MKVREKTERRAGGGGEEGCVEEEEGEWGLRILDKHDEEKGGGA